jgi:halocyanin-like protein
MFGDEHSDRRSFVQSTVTVALLGSALAGCTGGSGGASGGDGGGSDGGSSDGGGSDGGSSDGGGSSGGARSFGGWMSGVENYDGVVDETGSSEVTVTVGAEGNGGHYAFEPAAIRVSTGTTVVWEWTGKGASHNVVAEEGGDMESELTQEKGFTFEHTFEEPGTVNYQCTPHVSLGMKGVVIVE